MGNIVGGLIGGAASLFGGQSAKSNALTGYNYLTGANGTQGYVNSGNAANTASANLLGLNGATGQAQSGPAFQNYLNSTGYKFQRDQGTAAITGSAAARGLLNSGSTGKALEQYGQNLANTGFNNYLSQLNGQSTQGLTAAGQIGNAGTEGGQTAAKAASGEASGLGGSLLNIFGL